MDLTLIVLGKNPSILKKDHIIEELKKFGKNQKSSDKKPSSGYSISTNLLTPYIQPYIQNFLSSLLINEPFVSMPPLTGISQFLKLLPNLLLDDPLFNPEKKMIIPDHLEKFFPKGDKNSKYPFSHAFKEKYPIRRGDENRLGELLKKNEYDENIKMLIIDIILFIEPEIENAKYLLDISSFLLEKYNIDWAIRYINVYCNYFIWFIKRCEKFLDSGLSMDVFTKVIKYISQIAKSKVYWEYHNRNKTDENLKEGEKIMEEISNLNDNILQKLPVLSTFKNKAKILHDKLSK
ncbi:MAG: hypothetical protein ACTSRA_22395 [Promethearchaeota archaeon]